MVTKNVIKQARQALKEYATKDTTKKSYLNVLNSGVFIDLEKLKSVFFSMADSALIEFDKELKRRLRRRAIRH